MARFVKLTDRRKLAPYGLAGGDDGERGRAFIIRREGGREELTSKGNWQLEAGDRVRIETPGGGGFGKPDSLD
jgi:N-methylhydantoinase B/oxoprolinase/acetone carboxylase alpha subunit